MILEAVNNCNGIFPCGLIMFYKGVKITKQEFNSMKERIEYDKSMIKNILKKSIINL